MVDFSLDICILFIFGADSSDTVINVRLDSGLMQEIVVIFYAQSQLRSSGMNIRIPSVSGSPKTRIPPSLIERCPTVMDDLRIIFRLVI